jgi:hypothetical protein
MRRSWEKELQYFTVDFIEGGVLKRAWAFTLTPHHAKVELKNAGYCGDFVSSSAQGDECAYGPQDIVLPSAQAEMASRGVV